MDRSPAKIEVLEEAVVPSGAPVPVNQKVRRCPNTGTLLQPFHYLYDPPIVLDECPECGGVWVDDGELAKMLDWLAKSRAPITTDEKKRVATAKLSIEAEQALNRQNALIAFMQRLNRRPAVWP
jgi:Zn-finger nucleic acid-binding protein